MSYKYSKSKAVILGTDTLINQVSTGLLTASVVSVQSKILNRTVISSSYDLRFTSYFIGVDTQSATGSITINLPSASGSVAGRTFLIKDEMGNCNNNNIVLQPSGSDTVDGQSSITIDSPYASLNLYTDGLSRWFIY
jgi:hypothetical protein